MAAATGPRTKVLPQRVTGKIIDWKGKMGWIEPDVKIDHPEEAKHRGRIYLSIQDVEAEIEGVGSTVSFFVYADGSGLGAMNCGPADHDGGGMAHHTTAPAHHTPAPWHAQSAPRGGGDVPAKRPRTGGAGYQKEERISMEGEPMTGTVKQYRGFFGWLVPDEKPNHPRYKGQLYVAGEDCEQKELLKAGARVNFTLYTDSQGLGAENVIVDEEAPEGAEEEMPAPARSAPKPALLMRQQAAPAAWTPSAVQARATPFARPGAANGGGMMVPAKGGGKRRRISELEVTGEIVEWNSAGGWITPYDAIEHPAAAKNDGKIRVASADIQGEVKELEEGQLVQFHVFMDNAGLGAEEVVPF